MAEIYYEDHPTDPDKVIIRKPYPVKFFDAPQREWVGLNNDDWIRIYNHADKSVGRGAELAEEILKEKNT